MTEIDVKKKTEEIIKKLVKLPYSEIFQISPIERDLTNLHLEHPSIPEPLLGMMFCSIMLGNKQNAINVANKIWNTESKLPDVLEMLYSDCLINIGEFEKAQILINSKMDNVQKYLNIFYGTLVKYALFTGNIYILNNLANDPEIYITEPPLFDFAAKYYEGINNKHYNAILKIIYDTVGAFICTMEYLINTEGTMQLCLYTTANTEENTNLQKLIYEKINGYYLSMQEDTRNDISVRLQNINLHPAWW